MLGLGIEQDSSGNLIGECTSIGNFYYLLDGLSSVVGLMAGSGSLVNTYLYDPYGLSLNKSETVANPWQYVSGYYDAHIGLYKFGTRYYDPQLGRWTQLDLVGGSIGKIGSGNPYVYAGDVPNMRVDPSGWDCITVVSPTIGILISTGGVVAALGVSIAVALGTLGILAIAEGIIQLSVLPNGVVICTVSK